MNERCPFPKRYWVYLIVVLICSVLLIANIYRTDGWTGDKQFSEFTESEWQLFFTFIIEEIIIAGVLFLFAFLASAICKKTHLKIAEQWETDKFLGIKTDDYDFVWFDFRAVSEL